MTLVFVRQGRTETRDIVIKRADDTTITPGSSDEIRASILHLGETPKLVVASNAATANGSTFTKNTPASGTNRLRLDALDLAGLDPGTYTLMIDYQDASDEADWKNVDRQVLQVEET
jgi:hypothetical protein